VIDSDAKSDYMSNLDSISELKKEINERRDTKLQFKNPAIFNNQLQDNISDGEGNATI